MKHFKMTFNRLMAIISHAGYEYDCITHHLYKYDKKGKCVFMTEAKCDVYDAAIIAIDFFGASNPDGYDRNYYMLHLNQKNRRLVVRQGLINYYLKNIAHWDKAGNH